MYDFRLEILVILGDENDELWGNIRVKLGLLGLVFNEILV